MKSVRIQIFYAALLALILMSGLTMLCYEAYGSEVGAHNSTACPRPELDEKKGPREPSICTEIPGYSMYNGCGQAEEDETGEFVEACAEMCPERKGFYQDLHSEKLCDSSGKRVCCCKG